jgi:hypothetical protein
MKAYVQDALASKLIGVAVLDVVFSLHSQANKSQWRGSSRHRRAEALRRLVAAVGGNPLAMDNNATSKASRTVLTKKTVE